LGHETASLCLDVLPATEAPMHWRKSPQPPSQFNAYLAGWAIALSVVLVTAMILIRHGHV
jgi:hypothetical protein